MNCVREMHAQSKAAHIYRRRYSTFPEQNSIDSELSTTRTEQVAMFLDFEESGNQISGTFLDC
uniref:Uncharacterized protein n=1 Tax=Cyriopagopus schmidti TaxID=29017 RepID=B5M6F4_CYRSC|nr:unknown [Cyriopagopus schmidti]